MRGILIYRLQEARLQLLTKLLKQREQNHADLNIKRLDKMWRKKQKEKEAFIQKVRHEHIRGVSSMSKLSMDCNIVWHCYSGGTFN